MSSVGGFGVCLSTHSSDKPHLVCTPDTTRQSVGSVGTGLVVSVVVPRVNVYLHKRGIGYDCRTKVYISIVLKI